MTISGKERGRATLRFMIARPSRIVALGGGLGLSPIAPGTVATLATFPIYWALAQYWSTVAILALLVVGYLVGMWACAHTANAMEVSDPGAIVWDEVIGFLLVLVFTPPTLNWQIAAFALFRFFDIVKPPPIGYFDRTLRGGFGIMFDDLLAAIATLLVLAAARGLVIAFNG